MVNNRSILSSEGILQNDYNRKVFNWQNKITGRESQGAWRQDELAGGKEPVVK
jgi:hypothetical protein